MRIIRSNAKQLLENNRKNNQFDEAISLQDYAIHESCVNPDFYRWIFNDDTIDDFGDNISNAEDELVSTFLLSLS